MNLNDTVVLELTIVLKSKIKNMKKINLKNAENALSRAEMKTIMAGFVGESLESAGVCDSWRFKEFSTCYNCCITVYSSEDCLKPSNCGGTPVVIRPNN